MAGAEIERAARELEPPKRAYGWHGELLYRAYLESRSWTCEATETGAPYFVKAVSDA